MIKQTGTTIVPLTHHLATDFATMPAWRGERPLSQRRVDHLRRELEAGNFHAPKWAVAKLGSRRIRMNGQHSSFMLANANGHFPEEMNVVIDEFAVDDEVELGELFTRFDPPESVRPPREQLSALLAAGDLVKGGDGPVRRQRLERIASGLILAKSGFVGKPANAHARAAALHGDVDFIEFVWPFATAKGMNRPAILAAIYLTWAKAKEQAQAFWTQVRDESHPSATHPTRVLARALRDRIGAGSLTNDQGRELGTKCIHAWNNWRRGIEVTRLPYRKQGQVPEAA